MIYEYSDLAPDSEVDLCTECKSENIEFEHYNSNDEFDYYRCLDCDELFILKTN